MSKKNGTKQEMNIMKLMEKYHSEESCRQVLAELRWPNGVACPRCGGHSNRPGPWPWYLGTIGAIFVSARLCNLCGHEFDARKPQADFAKRKFNLALLINGFGGLGIVTIVVLLGWFIYVTMR